MKRTIDEKYSEDRDWDSIEPEREKTNWKIIGFFIGVLLVGVGFFLVKEFTSKKILNIRANDVSDSGLEHREEQVAHCKVNQRLQKVGDISVVIEFADKAEIVNDRMIENPLDFTSCEFDNSAVGKLPGTSLLDVLRLANKVVKGYRSRGIDYPLVFTLTLDAVEPVPGKLPFSSEILTEVASIAKDLTSDGKGEIVIIGPSSIDSLQDKLKTLEADMNLRVCPFSNVTSCTEDAIQKARQ